MVLVNTDSSKNVKDRMANQKKGGRRETACVWDGRRTLIDENVTWGSQQAGLASVRPALFVVVAVVDAGRRAKEGEDEKGGTDKRETDGTEPDWTTESKPQASPPILDLSSRLAGSRSDARSGCRANASFRPGSCRPGCDSRDNHGISFLS